MNTKISILNQFGEIISEAINDMDIDIPDNITNQTIAYKVLKAITKPRTVSKIDEFLKNNKPSLIEPDNEYIIEKVILDPRIEVGTSYYKVNSVFEHIVLYMAKQMLTVGMFPTTINVYDHNLTNILTITSDGVLPKDHRY